MSFSPLPREARIGMTYVHERQLFAEFEVDLNVVFCGKPICVQAKSRVCLC